MKEGKKLFFVFGFVLLLSLSFVSAGNVIFEDGKIYSDDNLIIENPKDFVGNGILISEHYYGNNYNLYAGEYCKKVQGCTGFKDVIIADDNVKACRCDDYWGCEGQSCVGDVSLSSSWERVGSVTCTGCGEEICVHNNCEDLGYECGEISDGCNRIISCGECETGYGCSGGKCISELVPLECYDDDGGDFPFVYGLVTDREGNIYYDSCYDSNNVLENICSNGYPIVLKSYFCENGCDFGKCIEDTIVGGWTDWFDIDNPSGSGDYEMLTNENIGLNVCENLIAIECETTTGIDFSKTGENVHIELEKGCWCVNSEQDDGRCDYDYKVRFNCGEGAGDSCVDSDGDNPFLFGYVIDNKGVMYNDSCSDFKTVIEGRCTKSGTYSGGFVPCENGCVDGACVEESNLSFCEDSDGKDFFTKGLAINSSGDYEDFCYNSSHVVEYFCSRPIFPRDTISKSDLKLLVSNLSSIIHHCEAGCEAGVCKKVDIINKKNLSKYSEKEVFLISDQNWKNVLPLVPLTTWTQQGDFGECQRGYGTAENVCVYPTLIYHDETVEGRGFDVDSIIYFMQQFNAEKVKIFGGSSLRLDDRLIFEKDLDEGIQNEKLSKIQFGVPQELINLLIAEQDFGAGLEEDNINYLTIWNYLSYWESYEDIVYVEDNYELALIASTYASLINAPLIIQGTYLDIETTFAEKNIVCVGNVGRSCDEQYNLKELQKKYVEITNTDKIILVNPNDLNIKVEEEFQPEKSGSSINEIYSKTSLAAPILASAKHEVIISTMETDYESVDSEFKSFMNENYPNFLEDVEMHGEITPRINRLFIYNILTESINKIYPDFMDRQDIKIGDLNENYVLGFASSSCHFTNPECKYFNSFYFYNFENNLLQELELGENVVVLGFKLYKNKIVYLEQTTDESWIIKLKSYNLNTHEIIEHESLVISSTQGSFFLGEKYVIFDFIDESNNKKIAIYNLETDIFNYLEKSYFGINTFSGEWIILAEKDWKTHAYNIFTNEDLVIVDGFVSNPNVEGNILTYKFLDNVVFYNLLSEEIEKEIYFGDFEGFYSDLEILIYQDEDGFTHLYNLFNDSDEIILEQGYRIESIGGESLFFSSYEQRREFPIKGYLTIMASPNAIQLKIFDGWTFGQENYRPAETSEYADFLGDKFPNMFTGRILGFTISDVSGYVARDLFHNIISPIHKNLTFIASSPEVTNLESIQNGNSIFNNQGYDSLAHISEESGYNFDSEYWKQNQLISYFDHGCGSWAGISSSQIPNLVNSIILNDACSTCANVGKYEFDWAEPFCVRVIRKGALAHIGALNIAGASFTYEEMINNFYYKNLNLGQAYSLAYTSNYINLLGDPTFNFTKPYILNEPIDWEGPW